MAMKRCPAPLGLSASYGPPTRVAVLDDSGVGSCACDVKPGDGFEVSWWTYGYLVFAVQDAQMRVLDDDGDDLAAVTGPSLMF